jgi:hypothetical protein
MPQGGGVVLVREAAGDLIDALADQHRQGMGAGFTSPFRDMGSNLGTETNLGIGTSEPGQPAVRGNLTAIEGGFEDKGREGLEGEGGCGRIGHEEASVGGSVSRQPDHTEGGFFFTRPCYE